jgi:hypothetical protein
MTTSSGSNPLRCQRGRPNAYYPGDDFIKEMQKQVWRLVHDLSQMKHGLEPRSESRIDEWVAEIKKKNADFEWWFERFPSIFDR